MTGSNLKIVRGLVVTGLLVLLGLGCGSSTSPKQEIDWGTSNSSPDGDDSAAQSKSIPELNPRVFFTAPEFELTDESGKTFSSNELHGRVWIANFIFTNCVATCPRQTAKLAELQARIANWPNGNRVRFLSMTVDPERDTPEVLLDYANKHQANLNNWKFLTGSRAELWRISKAGFKFPVEDNPADTTNPITHSSRFVMVDAESRVRGIYESLIQDDMLKLLDEMQLVLSEPVLDAPDPVAIGTPGNIFDPVWLEPRRRAQLAAVDQIQAFHDFRFEDRVEESGITFIDRPVADAAKEFRQNHYDHGNGIAAADVDGDGMIDLYFTSQVGGNQLWRNLGNGRFEDVTEAAGVRLNGRVSVAASFADTDNDGDQDLFVTTTRHGNAFFINDGQGHFHDVTKTAGLDYRGHSSSADFFDYDRDGLVDLLVTNVGKFTSDKTGFTDDEMKTRYFVGNLASAADHLKPALSERSVLYHNDGDNHFHDASQEMGFNHLAWSGDATPIDANNDGWTDLYVLTMQGNDVYYENVEGKRFVDKSLQLFPQSVWGGMGAKVFDFNNDGRLDVYVTNMHADMWQLKSNIMGPDAEKKRVPSEGMTESFLKSRVPNKNILGSALFAADSSGRYKDVAIDVGADNFWPWGPSVADLNGDGYQDIFVASGMSYPYRYHVNSVLLNDEGNRFRDAEFILGVEPRRGGRTAVPWFHVDCSGDDATGQGCKGRNGEIDVWGSIGTRSSVIFDLDQDGDLDIVTNDFNSPPMVLISDLSERSASLRYLVVQLRGTKSNRDGLGATVELKCGKRDFKQVHDGQSGYLSQSSTPLYFGLGDIESVDQITIRWPSGTEQIIPGPVAINQRLIVEEN